MPQAARRSLLLPPVLVIAAAAHAPALRATFVYDDFNDVVRNPSARAATFFERLTETVRPLSKATYALQDLVHGADPAAFHAVNLALHLLAAALVFSLLRRAVRLTGGTDAPAEAIAALAALLWAVHPALTETVTYVSGRSMGLSSVLVLGALLVATAQRPLPILAFACALMAPLARETALLTPLLLLWWQLTIDNAATPRERAERAAPVWAGAIVAAAILAAMPRHRDLIAFSFDQRDMLSALRANVFAAPEILGYWIEPWRVTILPAQPVIHGWIDSPTLLRIAGIGGGVGVALAMRRRAPCLAFAIGWTWIALLPSNSILWRVDPVALRPLYLAGIGLSLLIALALVQARRRLAGAVAGTALALVLSVMTFDRAGLYADEVTLWRNAVMRTPDEGRAHRLLGLSLFNAGRYQEARAALEEALVLDPFDLEARNAMRVVEASGPIHGKGRLD